MKFLIALMETSNAFVANFGPEFPSMYLFILGLPIQ